MSILFEDYPIDLNYFMLLKKEDKCIDIKSKCTRHSWKIEHISGYYILYHKHHDIDPYHVQNYVLELTDAIEEIICHDKFQLNGRKPTHATYTREGLVVNGRIQDDYAYPWEWEDEVCSNNM